MRPSTATYLGVFVLAAASLTLLIRLESAPRFEDGRRVYRFACWGADKEIRELEALIEPINARATDFRIRLVPIPSDYNTKLCTMIAGDTAPELFYLSQEHVAAFAAQGALLDLTDLVEQDRQGATDLDSYYPSVLEQFRWQGRLYGLPWIAQPVVLYCNVDAFVAAGVELPDRNWDWEKFVAAGKKLTRDTNGDGRIDQWGFILNGWPPYQMWVWQNGASRRNRPLWQHAPTRPSSSHSTKAAASCRHSRSLRCRQR